MSPGKTFCDPRKLTLEIGIQDWGTLVVCCFYGWDSKPQEGLRELDNMLQMFGSNVKPFVILGDFNIEVSMLRTHIEGMHAKPLVIEGETHALPVLPLLWTMRSCLGLFAMYP